MKQVTLQQAFDLALQHHQAGRLPEAENLYRLVLAKQPAHVDAMHLLGVIAHQTGHDDYAVTLMRQAIALRPDSPKIHSNLGNTLRDMGKLDEAAAAFRRAIELKPELPEVHANLGNVLRDTGQIDAAIVALRQSLSLNPDLAAAHSNLLYTLLFHPACGPRTIADEHRTWNQQHAEPLRKFIRPLDNNGDPNRKLRVGYVSADFWNHSVCRFLLPLLRHHDHAAFEIVCYSDVLRGDTMTERLRACTDEWHNIAGQTDEIVAERIRADKIDILVDLAGHTGGNRLRVFARRSAPVQLTYLGYPATTGLSEMDYRLTDSVADPPFTTDTLHTEKLWRLPVCNWCYSDPDDLPPAPPSRADGPICFGSFNNFAKMSPAIMERWAAILNATPTSRLIIKSLATGEASVQQRVRQFFASRGVDACRLDLRGVEHTVRSHLEVYNQLDIALDTFPYHGTTTTCEALSMGVPVVTLAGDSHVSRVGASLLKCAGFPDLIARSPEEYVSITVGHANDLPRLAELRRTLRSRMRASPLMDAPRFARDIESAYRGMWRATVAAREI